MIWAENVPSRCSAEILYIFRKIFFFSIFQYLRFVQTSTVLDLPQPKISPQAFSLPAAMAALAVRPQLPLPCRALQPPAAAYYCCLPRVAAACCCVLPCGRRLLHAACHCRHRNAPPAAAQPRRRPHRALPLAGEEVCLVTVQHLEFNISTFYASNFNILFVQFQHFIVKC